VQGGLLAILPAECVRASTTAHQGSQYLLQGERMCLVQPLTKGLMAQAYLPASLALRSDGVLYLTRQMKKMIWRLTASEVSKGTRTSAFRS
jgi:hypothetical protein